MHGTRTSVIFITVFSLVVSNLFAEVFFLRDGEVIIGELLAAGTGSVSIRTMGAERVVDAGKIIRTEVSLTALKDLPLEISLKDGTIISGRVVDYDEEIGLFVDISFGSLALPVSVISSIHEKTRVALYAGDTMLLGFNSDIMFPISDDFSMSWGMNTLAEFRTTFIRGLYFGIGISWDKLNYQPSSEVSFSMLGLSVHSTYKVLGLADSMPKLSFIVPYMKIGSGAALVQVVDLRSDAEVELRGILTGSVSVEAGIEWKLPWKLNVRSYGAASMVFQESGIFLQPKAGLGLLYGL